MVLNVPPLVEFAQEITLTHALGSQLASLLVQISFKSAVAFHDGCPGAVTIDFESKDHLEVVGSVLCPIPHGALVQACFELRVQERAIDAKVGLAVDLD